MLKSIFLVLALALGMSTSLYAFQHKDKSVHHAAMHAEHWVKHTTNPPTRNRHHYPRHRGKDRSTHHAAVHASHWLDHHLSAPHHH